MVFSLALASLLARPPQPQASPEVRPRLNGSAAQLDAGEASTRGHERVLLPAGRFSPLFGLEKTQTDLPVAAFRLDVRPVTQAAFSRFLQENPTWRREQISRHLAEARYLASFEPERPTAPAVDVSYFAARAYCAWAGGRLPTTLEWEYAAAADETHRDASQSPALAQRILDWYSKTASASDLEGPGSPRNVYGIEALHGLIWEWTEDFNAQFGMTDSRQAGDRGANFTCGAGTTGSARREDYAAFMRYALRSSLTGRATLPNLGFRCASLAGEPA